MCTKVGEELGINPNMLARWRREQIGDYDLLFDLVNLAHHRRTVGGVGALARTTQRIPAVSADSTALAVDHPAWTIFVA